MKVPRQLGLFASETQLQKFAASPTGANRKYLRANGWGYMLSAAYLEQHVANRSDGVPLVLDNGAWTYAKRGLPFDAARFWNALHAVGDVIDWFVVPDLPFRGRASLDMSVGWAQQLPRKGYLAVQDGMTPDVVAPVLTLFSGIFVGGGSAWKEQTIPQWVELARVNGLPCHVGRVNTRRRLTICHFAGATSFDGSGPSTYVKHAMRMDRWISEL